MLNEFAVTIDRTPGALVWSNYGEIDAELDRVLEEYKGLVYTEDKVKDAKKDRATLNKLKGSIDDAKKRAKKLWMEPYEAIDEKAKALTAKIDGQIKAIDESLDAFEKQRVETVLQEIVTYKQKASEAVPDLLRESFLTHTTNRAWVNKTFKKKEWMEAIDTAAKRVADDAEVIHRMAFNPTEEGIALEVYGRDFSLSDAMRKIEEFQRVREAAKKALEEQAAKKAQEELEAAKRAEASRQEPKPPEEPAVIAIETEEPQTVVDDNTVGKAVDIQTGKASDISLTDFMALFEEEEPAPVQAEEQEMRKVLCIYGKGDLMREIQKMAEARDLEVWYKLM